jgi:hypothetical protein
VSATNTLAANRKYEEKRESLLRTVVAKSENPSTDFG